MNDEELANLEEHKKARVKWQKDKKKCMNLTFKLWKKGLEGRNQENLVQGGLWGTIDLTKKYFEHLIWPQIQYTIYNEPLERYEIIRTDGSEKYKENLKQGKAIYDTRPKN